MVSHRLPSLADVPVEVVTTPYGRPALQALQRAVAQAKGGDALALVTVVVPSNHVGVTARRLLAAGSLGPVTDGGTGVAAVTFLTVFRLAELLAAPVLAAQGRRPVSTPVIAAAVRRALDEEPGMFAPVAGHPATERALVASFAELSDLTDDALDALAAASPRARSVVGVYRRARAVLATDWYDESDLTAAAVARVAADGDEVGRELGRLVVHLPQDLLRRQAELLAALAAHLPTTVVVGVTGRPDADDGVARSLQRMGVPLPVPLRPAPEGANGATGDGTLPPLPVSVEGTRIVTASDADDEVRAAVRRVVDAVRAGTPLERIALLYGSPTPYARLVHEHLAAAGIPRNGAAVRPLAASVLGQTVLGLLALPDHDFRRSDVLGLLARGADARGGSLAAAWERISRRAGVVAGRAQWDTLLARAAREYEREADELAARADERDAAAIAAARRQAERALGLRALVLDLVDSLAEARARPAPWAERVAWLRDLVERLAGHWRDGEGWPADEVRAAEKIDAALDRLAGLDRIADPAPLDVFRRTLELELEADLGRVGRFGEGVFVGPLSFAVGLDLDLVVVLGMAEGTLPAPVRDDALLADADRRAAGGQLELRRARVGRDHRRVLAALASADRHVLCVPRGDLRASSQRVPSRWLGDVAAALAGRRLPADELDRWQAPWIEHVPSFAHGVRHCAFPATDQEHRLRQGPDVADERTRAGAEVVRARLGRSFTRFDGNLAGVAVPSPVDTVVSATRLEAWARCPFAYFAERLLEVRPVEDPEQQLEMPALVRGSLVHEILERFVREVLARPPERRPGPGEPWSAADHARIREIAEEVCDEYEARGLTGRPVFWRRDRAAVVALADRFLAEDDVRRREAGARPLAAEHEFGFDDGAPPVELPLDDGRVLRFRGSIDRVDEGADGRLVVLDYKTGSARDYQGLSADDPDSGGTRLQLPVYALAARAMTGRPDVPVTAEYWFVSDRAGFARVGYPVDDDVLARVTRTIGTVVTGIERGVFPHHPVETWLRSMACAYCDPDGMGVADLRRAWERKRDDPAVALYAELAEPRTDEEAA